MKTSEIKISCDASPLQTFTDLYLLGLQFIKSPILIGDPPSEFVRLEQDPCSAGAKEVSVRLYPSDAFLRFAAAYFTGNLNSPKKRDQSRSPKP